MLTIQISNRTKRRPQRSQTRRGNRAYLLGRLAMPALLAMLVIAASGGSAGASSGNLVPNPSFEESLAGWAGNSSALQRVSDGADGEWSASVTAKASGHWSIAPSPRQVQSTIAGVVYNASAAVRGRSGSREVCLTLREWSGSTVIATAGQCLKPTKSWRVFPTISYSARGTGNSIDLYAWGRNGSKGNAFDVDAFSLTADSAPAAPLVVELTTPSASAVAGTVSVAASVTSGRAARVDFLANGVLLGSSTTSPYALSWNTGAVADGSVSLVARAVPASGSAVNSAPRSVQVDNTAPDTKIIEGPSGIVTINSASFSFTATESASFHCELDGGGWSACSSPTSYSGLPSGTHTFRVRAIDAVGNVDPTPASQSWTVNVSSSPSRAECAVDAASMTAPGCSIVREDTAAAADPRPGMWGAIECAISSRHQHLTAGGDPAPRADGTSQGDASFRSLRAVDGDDFYGQRCELGRNERRNGENNGSHTNGAFGLYTEGERKITFFSQRYGGAFNPNVGTWQSVFQQKQAQPYAGDSPRGVAIEIQIYGNKLYLANFWSNKWSTKAPPLGTWIRYALDVTYSADPALGKMRLYVDLNGDGDFNDPGEISPLISGATLAHATVAGHGLAVGDPIPSHTRIGIYNNPTIPCPAPSGCQVDVDNVQILR